MVPARQALARAFALADAASDEYEWRTAAHALYYALFHYAGEALATKTAGGTWTFYWHGHYPDGRPVVKTHVALQKGRQRYRNDLTSANDGRRVRRLLSNAHNVRKFADYRFDADFTPAFLDRLVAIVRRLIPIIDEP